MADEKEFETFKAEIEAILAKLPIEVRSVLFIKATDEDRRVILMASEEGGRLVTAELERGVLDRLTPEELFARVWLEGAMFATGWWQQRELERLRKLVPQGKPN